MLKYYACLVPGDLDGPTSEQRRDLYRTMHLNVLARDGILMTAEWACNDALTPQCSFPSTTQAFRFRALLTDGEREVRFERVAAG